MSNQIINPLYIDPTHLVPRVSDPSDVVAGSYTDVVKEPSGFPNRTDSEIDFYNLDRTFMISPLNGSFDVYIGGFKKTFSAAQSIQIPSVSGLYWIYFSRDTGLLAVQSDIGNPSDIILKHTPVAIIYWNSELAEEIYFGDERHGIVMDSATHAHLHQSIGTVYRSGLSLSHLSVDGNGSSNAHASFQCSNGRIADEDIEIIVNQRSVFETFYRSGSTWNSTTASSIPLFFLPGYDLPAFNYFNGNSWELAECQNNHFILLHVVSTNDANRQTVCLLGNSYQTKSQSRAAALSEFLSLSGLPFSEFVPICIFFLFLLYFLS